MLKTNKMSINSKDKGNRFEREIAKQLSKKFNTKAQRTPLSGGMDLRGDLIVLEQRSILFNVSFECKNQERLNIWKALHQCENDCERGKDPVVVFTKNHENTYAAMRFEDWCNLVKELEDLRNEIKELKGKQ